MVQQSHLPYHGPSHRPLTTAHLAQTMALLEMNNEELLEKVEGELANNPALELVEDPVCPSCRRPLIGNACPRCSFSSHDGSEDPIVFVSPPEDHFFSSGKSYSPNDDFSPEEYSPDSEDLPTFIFKQISPEINPQDRLVVAHILTSLNEDGLLEVHPSEIALFNHVPLSKVNELIDIIQHCEPIGAGSASPKEALLIQTEILSKSHKIDPLISTVIRDHWGLLTRQQFRDLGKVLEISTARVKEISNFISENLNPYPARAFWGNVRHHTDSVVDRYHRPDVIISTQGNSENLQLIIEVIWPIRGRLQLNPQFQKALTEAPKEKSAQWNEDFQKANLLIKCLGQRNHTLVQLMEKLALKQRAFILMGDAYTKPITRAQLAEEIQVHESTISRAVSGKSVQLPSGQIIPISKFFDRSLHIRTAMKKIIANEPAPLSDTKISKILSEQGYNIARRTVAKYRSMEGILPAHLRA